MIQKRRNILFVLMVITVMITGYVLNSHLEEFPVAIELSTETDSTAGGFQADCDYHEDENSKHVSQIISITENLSAPFTVHNNSLLTFQTYSVWQPPKNS